MTLIFHLEGSIKPPHSKETKPNAFIQELKDIWSNMLTLPWVIRQIVCTPLLDQPCWAQWYSSASSSFCAYPHLGPGNDLTGISSAWIAWFPVLFYSTLYVGDLHKRVSPIPTTDEARTSLDAESTRLGSRALFFSSLLALLANFLLPSFVPEAKSAQQDEQGTSGGVWQRICKVPKALQIHLATLWAVSHLIFAGCMFATL